MENQTFIKSSKMNFFIIQKCNQCEEYKKIDCFRVGNDYLNYNRRMKVCIECVHRNKAMFDAVVLA